MGFMYWQIFASLLLILPFISHVKGEEINLVTFLEGTSGSFLRNSLLTKNTQQSIVLSKYDVSAAVAVLLGLEPPSFMDKDTASKLDKILSPNPFKRPHTVVMLTIKGLEAESISDIGKKVGIDSVHQYEVRLEDSYATLELPEDVRFETLKSFEEDEQSLLEAEQELEELSIFLGASYKRGDKALQGTFIVPLPSGATVSLQLSQEKEQKFAKELASLYKGIRRAIAMRKSLQAQRLSELQMGVFSGLEGLADYQGSTSISKLASELFIYTTTKLFLSMEHAYDGHIVGIIVTPNHGVHASDQGHFDVKRSQRRAELLDDELSSDITKALAEILAEKIVAWIVGILLILAAAIGSYALFQMPLTRDTLLYSNAKLD